MIFQNVESELSYAYIHAIAAQAGISCKSGNRHDDNEGVDIEIDFRGNTSHPYLKHIQLNIQLKSTIKDSGNNLEYFSYFMNGKNRYEKLRTNDSEIYKILVMLFLPKNPSEWLNCTKDELILKKAAYWVNLYGAEVCENESGQTIYIPKTNHLNPQELLRLVDLAANKSILPYSKPKF